MNKWDIILYFMFIIAMAFVIVTIQNFSQFVKYDKCMLERSDVRICEKELDKLIPHWK